MSDNEARIAINALQDKVAALTGRIDDQHNTISALILEVLELRSLVTPLDPGSLPGSLATTSRQPGEP